MNYNHLYYFYLTVRAESFTAAAKALSIAQPSLSAQIKTLETFLARSLIDRSARRFKLTPEGEKVFGYCRKMFEPAEELEKMLASGVTGQERVQIGVSGEIERPFLVNRFGGLLRKTAGKPSLNVTMISETHDVLVHRLKTRHLDAIVTNQPVFDEDLTALIETRMPVVLAFRKNGAHRFLLKTQGKPIGAALRSRQIRWLLPLKGLRLRRESDLFFEKNGIAPETVFETDMLASLVRATAEDVGVALLPLPYVRAKAIKDRIDWIAPQNGYWKHGFWVIARTKEILSPAMTQLKLSFEQSIDA